jgi:predicted transporter
VRDPANARRRAHLHALAAGSLFVVAAFLVWAVPAAVADIAKGHVTAATLLPPLLFALLFGGGVREARAWHSQRSAQAI